MHAFFTMSDFALQTFGIQDLGLKMENARNILGGEPPPGLFPVGTATEYRHDYVQPTRLF